MTKPFSNSELLAAIDEIALGRAGDVAQRLGRSVQLTYEAAEGVTRSVPLEDGEARRLLGRAAIEDEVSFRDLILWMVEAGHLSAEAAGRLGEGGTP